MMLDFLHEHESAQKLSSAVVKVLEEAKTLTPDLGGEASTMEVTEAVKNAL